MPQVHVCPLSQVAVTVAATSASHLISVINDDTEVERPATIASENHLFIGMNDIVEPQDGLIVPDETHVRELLAFVDGWDRKQPIVIHCYAGISRSTAAAYVALCALRPETSEHELAMRMRKASSAAFPNTLIVAHGDQILGRGGRMIEAVNEMGRGELAFESEPFSLPVQD